MIWNAASEGSVKTANGPIGVGVAERITDPPSVRPRESAVALAASYIGG